jgi:hypothetical protein
MIVKRFFSAAVLGVAATALSVTPATAAPPEPANFTFGASECGFPVQVEVSGRAKLIVQETSHSTTFKSPSPNLRATLTNTDTGESVSYVITGVGRVTPTNPGVIERYTGHNLVFEPGVEGILFTTGTQTFVIDEGGETSTLTQSHGKVVNVCDVLA